LITLFEGWFQSKWADINNRNVPEQNQDIALKSNRGEAFETDENFSSLTEKRVSTFKMKSGFI
jgi:hypothetical protein